MATRTRIAPARRRVPQAQRRKRVWARDNTSININAAAGTAVDLLADFKTALGVTATPPGVTVGGVLFDFSLVQTAARAASEDGVFLGLIVSSETTATEVSRPLGEPHADWMWYQFIGAPGAASGANETTFRSLGGPLRLRAKRRMDEIGMNLFLVVQPLGLTTYTISTSTSVLLHMP